MENRIRLKIVGITYSPIQDGAYALVLAEEHGSRRIPIVIGAPEAQSIALRMERVVPIRPLTHDLFVSFAHSFGIQLQEVYIHSYLDGVFSADLQFEQDGHQITIDSRTSDAIAIAIRSKAPIYMAAHIVDEVGLTPEELRIEEAPERVEPPTLEQLQQQLQEAVACEAYEQAAQLQHEIERMQEAETCYRDNK